MIVGMLNLARSEVVASWVTVSFVNLLTWLSAVCLLALALAIGCHAGYFLVSGAFVQLRRLSYCRGSFPFLVDGHVLGDVDELLLVFRTEFEAPIFEVNVHHFLFNYNMYNSHFNLSLFTLLRKRNNRSIIICN